MRKEDENRAMIMQTAERIRKSRERIGYTQEETAEKAGLTAENYKKIEEGNNAMSIDSLRKVQKALDVSFDYILDGRTEPGEKLWQQVNSSDFQVRMSVFARLLRQFSREAISKEEIADCIWEALSDGTDDC